MISKELLSLVLGLDVMAVCSEQGGKLKYCFDDSCGNLISRESKINLDTLGRLCKEWCETQDYNAFSCPKMVKAFAGCQLYYRWNDGTISDEMLFFEADTELEAIVKATEFVVNEKGLL